MTCVASQILFAFSAADVDRVGNNNSGETFLRMNLSLLKKSLQSVRDKVRWITKSIRITDAMHVRI